MRKIGYILLGVVLIAAAAAAIVLAVDKSKSTHKSAETAATAPESPNKEAACAIFTLADAKAVLGDNAKGGAGANGTDSTSDDMTVSSCLYKQDNGSNVPVTSTKSASLVAHKPKTQQGITSNQIQFGPLKPDYAQAVGGYGQQAYWDPQLGQLDILKNDIWYVLGYGPTSPGSRSLDQTKQLADLLIDKM